MSKKDLFFPYRTYMTGTCADDKDLEEHGKIHFSGFLKHTLKTWKGRKGKLRKLSPSWLCCWRPDILPLSRTMLQCFSLSCFIPLSSYMDKDHISIQFCIFLLKPLLKVFTKVILAAAMGWFCQENGSEHVTSSSCQ